MHCFQDGRISFDLILSFKVRRANFDLIALELLMVLMDTQLSSRMCWLCESAHPHSLQIAYHCPGAAQRQRKKCTGAASAAHYLRLVCPVGQLRSQHTRILCLCCTFWVREWPARASGFVPCCWLCWLSACARENESFKCRPRAPLNNKLMRGAREKRCCVHHQLWVAQHHDLATCLTRVRCVRFSARPANNALGPLSSLEYNMRAPCQTHSPACKHTLQLFTC